MNLIKKTFIIIFSVVSILLMLVLSVEFLSYAESQIAFFSYKYKIFFPKEKILSLPQFIYENRNEIFFPSYKSLIYYKTFYPHERIRPVEYGRSKNNSIVILGCSCAYGAYLEHYEAFGYVLSKLSGRTVYNLAMSMGSPSDMLFMMQNDDFLNHYLNTNRNVEYFIYTYIPEHKYKTYAKLLPETPVYKKIKEGNNTYLKYERHNLLKNTFFYRNLIKMIYIIKNKLLLDNYFWDKELFNDYCLYMREIKKEINNKFYYIDKDGKKQNPKLILLVYFDFDKDDFKKLEMEGYKIVRVSEFIDTTDLKYRFPDFHPNAEAWKVIVPKLIQKLDLKEN